MGVGSTGASVGKTKGSFRGMMNQALSETQPRILTHQQEQALGRPVAGVGSHEEPTCRKLATKSTSPLMSLSTQKSLSTPSIF